MPNPTLVLAALAALVFIGFFLEHLFRKTGIPDVLILLFLGLILGVVGVLDVEKLRGFDRIFTTAALVLILFEGAVRMRLSELTSALGGSLGLTIWNFLFSIAIVTGVSVGILGLPPLVGALFGVILGGTSSAVVIPMVSILKMRTSTRTALSLESAFSDVLCIVFALALIGALSAGDLDPKAIGMGLGYGLLGALALGGAAGALWAIGLRQMRKRRSSFLAVGAAVFLVYAAAEAIGTFAAIAVLAFGIVLGNAERLAPKLPAADLEVSEGERFFLSEVAFLLKILFFVYLGARLGMDLKGWQPFVFGILLTICLLAIRIPVVRFSLRSASTPKSDALIATVMAPKGLAASVLAGLPHQSGIEGGRIIEVTTFGVVLFTIIAASALTYMKDWRLVSSFYGRFFRSYPESLPEETPAPEAVEPAPVTVPVPVPEAAAVTLPIEVGAPPPSNPPPATAAED
jgi:potassium/hydrogen antiporter